MFVCECNLMFVLFHCKTDRKTFFTNSSAPHPNSNFFRALSIFMSSDIYWSSRMTSLNFHQAPTTSPFKFISCHTNCKSVLSSLRLYNRSKIKIPQNFHVFLLGNWTFFYSTSKAENFGHFESFFFCFSFTIFQLFCSFLGQCFKEKWKF